MTASLRHRRRAERFAQLLDEASGGRRQRRRHPLDEELAGLVSLRHKLVDTASPPEIDPEFRAGLRAMLVATAEREGIGATAQPEPAEPPPPPARKQAAGAIRAPRARTAVIAGVAIGAVAFTGMSTASENAMPGDALYGVKRSAERAQLALASSDVGRGALYLSFAQTRLAEARLLEGDIDRVLDDMDRDATHGVQLLTTAAASRQDYAALDMIDEFAGEQRTALELLAGKVTGADADRVAASLDLLAKIEDRTAQLRDDLETCAGQPVRLDSLGPMPRECVALPAPASLSPQAPTDRPDQSPTGQPGTGMPAASGELEGYATPGPVVSSTGAPVDETTGPVAEEPAGDQPQPGEEDPAEPDEDLDTDDGGLLAGVNRLLGDLLGG